MLLPSSQSNEKIVCSSPYDHGVKGGDKDSSDTGHDGSVNGVDNNSGGGGGQCSLLQPKTMNKLYILSLIIKV